MAETTEKTPISDGDLAGGLTERRLSPRCWEAAVQAFHELYNRHADRLLLFLAARLPAADVAEVHRAVWRNVWQNERQPGDGGGFAAALQGIALSEIAERRKNRADRAAAVRPESAEAAIDPVRMAMMRESLGQLDSAVLAVIRGRLSGEGYEAISFALNLDVNRVREMFAEGSALVSIYLQRAAAQPS